MWETVCSYYEVLFKDISDPLLEERLVHHPLQGPNIFTIFQVGLLFLNYNYPYPPNIPKPAGERKKKKDEAEKRPLDTPQAVVSDEDVENLKASMKGRVLKPSGAGGQFEIVARPRDVSKSGEALVATMEGIMKEIYVKNMKIPVSKASQSKDRTLLFLISRKNSLSLSESIERVKKRKLETSGGFGKS
jgi:hypothetical protein